MIEKDVITLFPATLSGEIKAPSSKSFSHRAIIAAALSKGESRITNLVYSEDVIATIEALKMIGVKFVKHKTSLIVSGVSKIKVKHHSVDCNESGSTLRFLIPLFSLSNKPISFTGKQSLLKRPLDIYEEVFKINNGTFEISDTQIMVNGSIKAKEYTIKGDVSSQFFSGLFFALPLLKEDSTIYVDGELESKSYIKLTIAVLEKFGIEIIEIPEGFFIKGSQKYKATDYDIEGDYSQAAFYLVAGTLNGMINITHLNFDSLQGDKAIINIIQEMHGKIIFAENGFNTEKSNTTSTVIDLTDTPDLGPIVALLAALSRGTTHITNIKRLRHKESDRVNSIVTTLSALGANITATENEIIIIGRKSLSGGVTVDSYNDHRIAMMLAIAALRCEKEIVLTNAQAIKKSYPHFYKDYLRLGGKIE